MAQSRQITKKTKAAKAPVRVSQSVIRAKQPNPKASRKAQVAALSDCEREEIRDAFDALDEDGDGRLSRRELEVFLRGQFVVANDNEMRDFMKKMDVDDNGTVDYDEFEAFAAKNTLTKFNAEDVSDEMAEAFKVFDKDDDGFIDVNEFRTVMTALGDKITVEEVADMIREFDMDGDGKINYTEFCQYMKTGVF